MRKNKKKINGFAYVQFDGIGGYSEKLVENLIKNDISLFYFNESKSGICGIVKAKDYPYVKKTAKNYGIRISISEKIGLYFKLYKFRKRWGLIAGALCCAAAVTVLSQFLWDVRIEGNVYVSNSEICSVLKECGVFPGGLASSVDVNACEYRIMTHIEEISWVSVEKEGSRIYVKISEYKPYEKEDIPVEMPCNIISKYDGQLISATIKRGTFNSEVGSGIKKGQLLVSGAVDNNGGGMIYLHSEAELIARCEEEKEFYIPFVQKENVPTGKENKSSYLMFGNYAVPLFWEQYSPSDNEKYVYSEETSFCDIFGIKTPVRCRNGIYSFYKEKNVTYKTEDVIKQLEKQKSDYEENFYKDCSIVLCDKEFISDENGVTMKLKYTVDREVGEKQQIRILY